MYFIVFKCVYFFLITGQAKFEGRWRGLQEVTAGIEVWRST